MALENKASRIEIIEPLRGFAALAVAWFHFTNGGSLLRDGWLKAFGAYGWVGVEVFFVISGFVIPYSMSRGGYSFPRDLGKFLLKRILRLDPPYLVAIALTIGLWYASAAMPGFRGLQPHYSAPQLLLHLGYLNAFFGYPWVIPVFWTLAIEFQFYILASLAFPILAHRSPLVRVLALIAVCGSAYSVSDSAFVFHYGGLFALGVLTFHKYTGFISLWVYLALVVALAAATAAILGPYIGAVGLLTALVIAFVRMHRYYPLAFIGSVSYSVYLLHVPVGGRVVNFGARFADTFPAQLTVLVGAVVFTLIAAYLMYKFIESPAQMWSSSIRYKRRQKTQDEIATIRETTLLSDSQVARVVEPPASAG